MCKRATVITTAALSHSDALDFNLFCHFPRCLRVFVCQLGTVLFMCWMSVHSVDQRVVL